MSFLATLLHKNDRFLDLFEASVSESRASAQELKSILTGTSGSASADKIIENRNQEGRITDEIQEDLCQGRRGSFDSDEIEVLARALSRISKGIRKVAMRYQISAAQVRGADFSKQTEMLQSAVDLVGQMVSELRSPRLSATQAHHEQLQKIEGEADKLFIQAVMDLYRKREDPMRALMLRDLHELQENVIDRCRTAGNLILRIVLKHT